MESRLIPPIKPSAFIRHRNLGDRVVVLDLRVGQYLIFDAVASYFWNTLLDAPPHGVSVEKIARRFKITGARCEQDIDDFIRDCEQRGLLGPDADEAPRLNPVSVRRGSSSSLNAWKCLYATRRLLARSGFAKVYEIHSRLRPAQSPPDWRSPSLSTAIRAFRRAENFFPIREAPHDCLPRSLALHRFLLSLGIKAEHRIGVRHFPFEAHAWTEVAGEIVCDSRSFVGEFVEISRI